MGVMIEDTLTLYDGLIKTHITNTTVAKEDGKGLSTNDYTTDEKNKLAGIDKDLLDKLGESTEGNLTFNGDEINAAQMTGATADKDGTSGTVTAPKAGDQTKFLRGDGTWAEVTGGTKISPKATVNPSITSGNAKCIITWGDPEDAIADGIILSTWKGTKLVMKESGYPENENDGTVLVDNTIKDAYKTSGYVLNNLTNGNTYYFALFPYSTDGIYNYQSSNRLLGKPSLVKLDPCTDMNITSAMGSVTVTWTDPDATKTVNENTATWAKTVLVYKEGDTAPNNVSDGTVAVEETTRNQYQANGYTVNGLTDGKQYIFALFAVSTENTESDATVATAKLWATLTITTDETSLYSKNVTASYNSNSITGAFSDTGSVTLQIPWIGETTVTATDETDTANSNVTISAYENTYSVELSFLKIVTFADGTDEEIAAMIEAHYADKINISDYWAVGDKRSVSLSAMSATGVGESHSAQTVQLVIADFNHDNLATAINGHSKAAVTLTQVHCLNTKGYMNSSDTNSGGWTSCARRTWCNNVYFSALPSALQTIVKAVNKLTSAGSQSTTINTTNDKVFLPSEIEIFGSTTYSVSGEGTQYSYYKTSSNRIKQVNGSNSYWWERSPHSGSSTSFCRVYSDGSASYNYAGDTYGLAPCLCI